MSDRLDVVIVEDGAAVIHHQRWGATALVDLLAGGPEGASDLARSFDATDEITDVLAACVIDHDWRVLVLAGPSEVISSAGPRRLQPHEVLPTLEPFWDGWELAYSPEHVVEAVVLHVREAGIPLRSMNEPHVLADHLGKPRFVEPEFRLRASAGVSAPLTGGRDPSATIPRRSNRFGPRRKRARECGVRDGRRFLQGPASVDLCGSVGPHGAGADRDPRR